MQYFHLKFPFCRTLHFAARGRGTTFPCPSYATAWKVAEQSEVFTVLKIRRHGPQGAAIRGAWFHGGCMLTATL
jgi:hypothetical protein